MAVTVIRGDVGVGKTALALKYARAAENSTDVRRLRRKVADMDALFDQLNNDASQGVIELALPILFGGNAPPNLPPIGELLAPPAATEPHPITVVHTPRKPPATSVVPLVNTANHPWSSALDLALSSVAPRFSEQLTRLDQGLYTHYYVGESCVFAAKLQVDWSSLASATHILSRLRRELLSLVSRLRIILRCRIIRVLSGLSRFTDAINFVLLLLAASRCYGRRSEPSDYTLPVFTPMSVVIGEAACLC